MASKKSTKKTAKKKSSAKRHYPVVRGSFLGSVTETVSLRKLDVPRALSNLNRRLYRYARVYPVNVSMIPTTTQTVEVYALRDDWAVHQGIKMAYDVYRKNTEDERKMLGTQTARWEDFRCADGLAGEALYAKLHDSSTTGSMLTGGEFNASNIVDANDVQKTFGWGAGTATQFGILEEYDKSGNAQASPESETLQVPYADAESTVNQVTHTDLQDDGNNPPYDATGVNTATPWVKIATLGVGSTGAQRLSTGFFNAPCGIVMMVGSSLNWNSDAMMFEVQKGDYKGVGGRSLLE